MKIAPITLAIALAATLAPAPAAHAGTSAANATAFCQGALPAFDTQIRKRPLGVNNEGDSSAFVSCSIPVGHNPTAVENGLVALTNTSATAITVSCTLVDGMATGVSGQAPGYYPKSVAVAAGDTNGIVWTPGEYGLPSFSPYQNFSCNLPPGVELNLVGNDYTDSPT